MKCAVPDIDVCVEYDALRIYFNGALHVHIVRSQLIGVQSWMRRATGKYYVEFTLVGGTITCDYDTPQKWRAVLNGLARAL